ncbi:MAG: hypothetical protein M0C28_12915 [Candidatus Moduliflexus flocculans]|nr:hypothetical protein [Candidatus Moduliflexus flocculans]
MACWKDEAKTVLTLSIVNPTKRAMTLKLDAAGTRAAQDRPALPRRRTRSPGLQRAGQGAAGRGPRNGRRPVRQEDHGPPDQRLAL